MSNAYSAKLEKTKDDTMRRTTPENNSNARQKGHHGDDDGLLYETNLRDTVDESFSLVIAVCGWSSRVGAFMRYSTL